MMCMSLLCIPAESCTCTCVSSSSCPDCDMEVEDPVQLLPHIVSYAHIVDFRFDLDDINVYQVVNLRRIHVVSTLFLGCIHKCAYNDIVEFKM